MMSEVNFVCPTCGSSDFITKSSFDRHIKIDSVLSVVVENQYKYKSTLKKLNITNKVWYIQTNTCSCYNSLSLSKLCELRTKKFGLYNPLMIYYIIIYSI